MLRKPLLGGALAAENRGHRHSAMIFYGDSPLPCCARALNTPRAKGLGIFHMRK